MSNSLPRKSCQVESSSPLTLLTAMRGKSFVRMNEPGMHSSGPRPKSQSGMPVVMSSPTLAGLAQLRWAVPISEFPLGLQVTESCWLSAVVVLPLLKTATSFPLGRTVGSEPWSRSHVLKVREGSKKLPNEHRGDDPLISSGLDHVTAWSVDMVPQMAFEQNWSVPLGGAPQFVPNLNTVQVR